ncbi:glycosyltransferase [Prochlorococcus marinus]|uniref:Beta-monoglucosyldiacylglycerol synthase n=1 Tax=Prochlorococcus marinus XMU1408 TaxID=2213228 RepID=A0A318QZU1_PROMR|nr:glycosyltransferase family 2 protein [Prochlorococcus marinus]MBW3042908.1 glycosyl transferase family 2 [Prochlorococcus marinus str. XMU1408]PYE00263.1 glycosyl transferase family 2 [Prochlorococcus marinus XMU1408]
MALAKISGENRRTKSILFLICCAFVGIFPHLLEPAKNLFPSITLAFILGGYGLQVVLRDRRDNYQLQNEQIIKDEKFYESLPTVDVLVAARDEENVIERLVTRLLSIEYPEEKISLWIIDDGSQDNTPNLLKQLSEKFSNINIFSRTRMSGGGKSGALNSVLKKTKGEWLFILDADAQLQSNVLIRAITLALHGGWSAVQLRKAVINCELNQISSYQAMEMAMDAVIQRGRLATGGVAELRGNGQLINRKVLDSCGGFNEQTITDDLDLSFRFLLTRSPIVIMWDPPVQEEAVDSVSALFRQRKRWAEGGLQRFFDYWPLLISNRLTNLKKLDLTCFFLLQYVLPVVSFIDLLFSIILFEMPLFWPLSIVAFGISSLAYWKGCSAKSEGPKLPSPNFINVLGATIYLSHWFIVIPFIVFKMSLFPKSLIWEKTNHSGS